MQAQTDALCPLRVCNSSHSHTNDKCTFVQHHARNQQNKVNSCAKRERRNCYTVAREMSHCYPHFHHNSKISKVAWYLLVPWLRLLRLGSALPMQSFHLWRPFCGLVFGLEVWSYAPQRKHTDLRAPWFPPKGQPITFVGVLVDGTPARISPRISALNFRP